jgi:hypothetical protein
MAENENVFREANETLRRAFEDADEARLRAYPFLCECGDRGCTTVVLLALEDYEQIRRHPARFLISPGHEFGSERLVNSGDGYEVIEKVGAAGELVRAYWNRLNAEHR